MAGRNLTWFTRAADRPTTMESAHNVVQDWEELDDIRKDYLKLAEAARKELKPKRKTAIFG